MQKPQNRTFILILRLAYFSLMMRITIVNDLQKYVDSWENCQRVQTRNDHQKISNNNVVEFASNFRQNNCALVPILIWYFLRKKVAKKIHEKTCFQGNTNLPSHSSKMHTWSPRMSWRHCLSNSSLSWVPKKL